MEILIQGLVISIFGAGGTFLALGLLVLVIYLLRWVFQKKEALPPVNESAEEDHHRLAAAIAVAICLQDVDEPHSPSLGKTCEKPPSHWWYRL